MIKLSFAFHVIGIVLWVAGLAMITLLEKYYDPSNPANKELILTLAKKALRILIIPGLALVIVTGVYQLFSGGLGAYMKQGWFHLKLLMLVILFVVTVIVKKDYAKMVEGWSGGRARSMMLHMAANLAFVIIVIATFLKF